MKGEPHVEQYEKAQMDVIEFENEDVIGVSGGDSGGGLGDGGIEIE